MQYTSLNFSDLFNKQLNSTNEVDVLHQLSQEHPYFSIPHYFRAKHQPTDKHIGTANLHFHNPYWLNYLLTYKEEKENSNTAITQLADEQIMPQVEIKKEESKEETLLFQPLHTSDYFASMGIKISADVKPDDKLGKQLKSFTEWLKTMKKVNFATETTGNAQAENFHPVFSMAEKSNAAANVLTESMAEILVEQGKMANAIEIYQKLSLLNPSKSAFFAAKIEKLKAN